MLNHAKSGLSGLALPRNGCMPDVVFRGWLVHPVDPQERLRSIATRAACDCMPGIVLCGRACMLC